jgi:hypothetical protein
VWLSKLEGRYLTLQIKCDAILVNKVNMHTLAFNGVININYK